MHMENLKETEKLWWIEWKSQKEKGKWSNIWQWLRIFQTSWKAWVHRYGEHNIYLTSSVKRNPHLVTVYWNCINTKNKDLKSSYVERHINTTYKGRLIRQHTSTAPWKPEDRKYFKALKENNLELWKIIFQGWGWNGVCVCVYVFADKRKEFAIYKFSLKRPLEDVI